MASLTSHDQDFLFAEHCLAGNPPAIEQLRIGPLNQAEAFVIDAGIAPDEASEIARDLWADLLASGEGRTPLLQRYHGRCALTTWLNRVALSRAWFRRRTEGRRQRVLANAEAEGALIPTGYASESDPAAEYELADQELREMLKSAVRRALDSCPAEDFVLLHLMHAGDLQVQELTKIFKCDRRTLHSRAETASGQVRFSLQAELQAHDPWLSLTFDDALSLLQADLPQMF